jgi:uncharacterized membrane protein
MSPHARALAWAGRFTRARSRLLTALAVGALVFLSAVVDSDDRLVSRALFAWDAFVATYFVLTGWMVLRSGRDDMRRRAAVNDNSGPAILAILMAAIVASFVAIVVELATVPAGGSPWRAYTLAGTTVVLSWFFTHTLYAVHYAHVFYQPDDDGDGELGGLHFPGDHEPDYLDFLYFSFVIGCATATADIDIRSRRMRRLAMVHGVLAFFYNTAVLALTINIAAGRVGG